MSTKVIVTIGKVLGTTGAGSVLPVLASSPIAAGVFTSSGVNQQIDAHTSLGAVATNSPKVGHFWTISAKDGPILAAFGPNPDATVAPQWMIPAGSTRDFSVTTEGEKLSICDA